jgi:hypothetical protein
MVDEVRPADPAKDAEREERAHRKPFVHEPVVDEHVANTEERHPGTRSDEQGTCVSVELASDDDERCRDGGVEDRERVVPLETSGAWLVVRAMNAPERAVPDATVEEASPELHRRRDDGGRSRCADDLERRPAAHEAPP